MICWPSLVPLLITRYLYLGCGASGDLQGELGISGGYWGLHMKYADGLLQSTLGNWRQSIADNRTWAECNWTKVSTILGHEIALMGGVHLNWGQLYVHYYHSLLSSVVYTLVPFFTTRYLYLRVHLSWAFLSVNVKVTLCLPVNVKLTWCSTVLGHQMPPPGVCLTVSCLFNCIPENVNVTLHLTVNVKQTWSSTALDH